MAENSSIEWTDHTWTPVVGCDAVSPACANCYAALMAARLEAMGQEKYRGVAVRQGGKGKWTGKVNFWAPELVKPLTVRKASRWFLTSMGDVAHEALTMEQIAELFGVMAVAGAEGPFHRPQDGCREQKSDDGKVLAQWPNMSSGPHTFMALTKRGGRMAQLLLDLRFRELVSAAAYRWAHDRICAGGIADHIYPPWCDFQGESSSCWPIPNVSIGCTAENQERADELRPHMAAIAAAGWKTFVSYEPALGPVDWAGWEFLSQLISGGESGHKARPSHPDWHRGARDWAEAHDVPYMFKQWGEWIPETQQERSKEYPMIVADGAHGCPATGWPDSRVHNWSDGTQSYRCGKKEAGRLLDGRTHEESPT